MEVAERSGAHLVDGHFSVTLMMRHHGQLSGPEASQRATVMGMLRDLQQLRGVYGDGLLGTDQVRRLARVWANPRVREYMGVCETAFITAAAELEYVDFDLFCRQWESRVDADGPERSQRRWRRREVKLVQDFNGFWDLRSRMMSLDGAELHEILARMVDAERLADIEVAKAEHGDNWRLHLPRTTAQLRYDALMELVRRGAGAEPGSSEAQVVTNLMIDEATFEESLALLVGAEPGPIDALAALDPNRFARTSDGIFVNPAEIVARALVDHVRRVVTNSAGVVINMSRKHTLFTGSTRDAAMFQALRCYWKACWIPASKCQIDHLTPRRKEGLTNPGNGAPACGHHNRIKEQGFHAWRDPAGQWHIARPDGTPVPDHLAHWPRPQPDVEDGSPEAEAA